MRSHNLFSGFRIAHTSVLHNTRIGSNNINLLTLLCETQPDIIAITGDLIDSRRTDISVALQFAEKANKIAPCYYVAGNHEARTSEYPYFKDILASLGITVLEDTSIKLESENEVITLIGVSDPSFSTAYLLGDSESVMQNKLQVLVSDDNGFQLLLSHRPELFDIYAKNNLNLVLSGHAHGGQFRIPLIGGLYAPNQGLFPLYDAGLYTDNKTSMIVSRGIGNSIFPIRFNNRPEIIIVELQTV